MQSSPAKGAKNAPAKPTGPSQAEELDNVMKQLFRAYDLDESGELSRDEFLAIEMRISFEEGEVYKGPSGAAKMTLADKDNSGSLDCEEFKDRFLTLYTEMGMSTQDTITYVREQVRMALTERAKMGPRYHAGIRKELRNIFSLFDVSGDGNLSPEEWIAAQKTVALEISDDMDEGWIDEAAFAAADSNGDGVLDVGEFLEASFNMFEGVKKRTDDILNMLTRIVRVLEQQRRNGVKETQTIYIMAQVDEKPEFQPPRIAWQDCSTSSEPDKSSDAWSCVAELKLPLNLQTSEDVAGLVRLSLSMPADTWISIFYLDAPRDGDKRPVTLLRGDEPGKGNVTAMLQYLTKPHCVPKLFIKNHRKRPQKLIKQPRAFLEEREQLLTKRVGQCWGLDWETQLVGDGQKLPRDMIIAVGDAVVVEVPQTDDAQEYRYVAAIYMDKTDILSKAVDENIEPKSKKKKKKAPAIVDNLLQLTFVGLKEGTCVLFVDVSWEDQEEKLATAKDLTLPVSDNSIARIGPILVDVQKPTAKQDKSIFQWWNGEKWTNKKGPAKKKKGRK